MNELFLLFLILAAVGSLTMVVIGVRRPSHEIVIEERLAQFGNRIPTLEELELQHSFRERVLLPATRNLAIKLGRFAPRQNHERLKQQLMEAGAPRGLGATEFAGLRLLLMFGLGGLFALLLMISETNPLFKILLPIVVGGVGYFLPAAWLSRRIRERQSEIVRALPDAIDLLTISVEAGLGFDPALARVVEKWDNALTREFGRTLSELLMGQSRRDALRDLTYRANVEDLNIFISAVLQADQLGVSISQVLRVQSRQMRQRRRQRAEEKAHKAPIKMIFPMVFLIFPSIYIVILGPALPKLMESFT